ncbi:MAG: DNA polymerase I [Clostridia bacterium]|nr:DNA polymerase I [Clostridia bacterium]
MKRILVIDGNSIINRAYYGMRPLTTKSGKSTHAVYGMINMISRQLADIKPDYAAVAFDLKAPTFRHKMYDAYKAGRHATPEDLISQFPDAKECLALMGLHIMELEGYEADDIQGTVARLAHTIPDAESYIFSGDRDLLQLIDDKVTVLLAKNSDTKVMRRAEFREEYGIEPEQFVDMKALMGDSSDNIPGVAGVGKKTAEALIVNFGTLDGIYDNIDDSRIAKGAREKLLRDRENAYLSRELAKINTEAPIGKSLEELAIAPMDKRGLYAKFTELELNSLIAKFHLKEADAPKQDSISEKFDSEKAGITSPKAPRTSYKNFCASDFTQDGKKTVFVEILNGIVYISCQNSLQTHEGDISEIAKFFENSNVICHDGKSLWHALDRAGADLSGTVFYDLSLYAYVLNPGSGASTPASLVSMFLGESVEAGESCVAHFEALERVMRDKAHEDGVDKILFGVEIPLMPILAETEKAGFKINTDGLIEFGEALAALADDLTARIYMQVGHEFNINSPKQLGEVLFEELGLPCKKKKTKTGYSTDAETLEELRAVSPIVDDILEYRQVTKLKNTYTTVLVDVADGSHRIHTDFKQALTATGRLSSADPNLQNIPIKTKMGREMRRNFIAEEGYSLVDADYSQIELRLLAHISDDYNMKEAFINGDDIHRKTASAVFGVPEETVNEEMRKRAKAVNFGIVYGISGFSLAKDVGTSVAEASKYIKSYLMNYPSIDRYLEEVVERAAKDGYTTTEFGRRRYIPELSAQNGNLRAFGKRVAMNAPIQGTAADIMKMAMINVYRRLKRESLDARIVMQVHDELVIEVADSQIELCKRIVKEEMENTVNLSIPLTADVTSGKNWLEQE